MADDETDLDEFVPVGQAGFGRALGAAGRSLAVGGRGARAHTGRKQPLADDEADLDEVVLGAEDASVGHGRGKKRPGRGRGQGQSKKPSRAAKKNDEEEGDMMDWTDAYTSIVCNLFAEQVKKGNRPNTHLNSVGYTEVSNRFYQMTGIYLSKMQLKNKWDKLKIKLSAWNRLMKRQTGTGWDRTKGVIDMDDEWWRKARKDIPGCGGFRTKPLQNVDDLTVMFGDIINDETDHWNPMSSNPIIPQNDDTPIEVDLDVGENLDGGGDDIEDNGGVAVNDIEEVSPSIGNAKRRSRVLIEKGKKAKTGTALVIQEKISEIAEQAKAFTSRKVGEVTVEQVMDLVLDCGAGYGTDEHFIATELFVKKDQRDMFMTLPTKDIRFGWLTRKFNVKYGN
ncbi:L10-interacting MYB domain-containing protein-like [Setaria italica]|uniref:L10-interacting MYB domain-containing protein-like n=1 Tax=Setaria italica TaxID=4555 RepID=UPI000BE6161E|nr:L10-interacting MYB domain-containing protein-like [Setaria italica]XP_022685383.1 L10-interacting MYB domain-containing protein-like [Setaria italica]